jgi:hypothetical protein
MGYFITIKNDLLDPKHVIAMGSAVWLYMWLMDKVMAIDENGIGKVFNGRPVTYEEVKADLGISRRTYLRWVEQLECSKYIYALRAPYGLIFSLMKAEKMWGQRTRQEKGDSKGKKRYANNGTSKDIEGAEQKSERYARNGTSDMPEMAQLNTKNGTSNNNNSSYNSRDNNINTTDVVFIGASAPEAEADTAKVLEAEAKPKRYGKPEINDMFDYWAVTVGYEIRFNVKNNRNACQTLLTSCKGVDLLKRLIDGVAKAQQDSFAPRISDFVELQKGANKLIAWGQKKGMTNAQRGVDLTV